MGVRGSGNEVRFGGVLYGRPSFAHKTALGYLLLLFCVTFHPVPQSRLPHALLEPHPKGTPSLSYCTPWSARIPNRR